MSVRASWFGDKAKALSHAGAARGLQLSAEHVLEESRRVVPIEESTLEKSGVASSDPGALKAAVSYDTVYACRQHEELTWAHDAGRQAKYLEAPLNAAGSKVLEIIAREIKGELGA